MQEHTSARAAQILREKGYSARALLGGWAAWTTSGGETEPAAEPRPSPPPQDYPAYNPNAATQKNVNTPTVDDSKTPAVVEPLKSKTSAPVEPKRTVKRKSKRHHRGAHASR
jgi:3-mercaptopyruvate sulfurtransferase SseA